VLCIGFQLRLERFNVFSLLSTTQQTAQPHASSPIPERDSTKPSPRT
jgi:hypothetical protein